MMFTFKDLELSYFTRELHKGVSDIPQLTKRGISCPPSQKRMFKQKFMKRFQTSLPLRGVYAHLYSI